jgi:hypothetical protein
MALTPQGPAAVHMAAVGSDEWIPIGELRSMDLELTATGPPAEHTRALVPAADRCESCGTYISLVSVVGLARILGGLDEGDSPPAWMEQQVLSGDRVGMQLRPHTPERCRRVRAGDPEPWTDIDDEDDEDA